MGGRISAYEGTDSGPADGQNDITCTKVGSKNLLDFKHPVYPTVAVTITNHDLNAGQISEEISHTSDFIFDSLYLWFGSSPSGIDVSIEDTDTGAQLIYESLVNETSSFVILDANAMIPSTKSLTLTVTQSGTGSTVNGFVVIRV